MLSELCREAVAGIDARAATESLLHAACSAIRAAVRLHVGIAYRFLVRQAPTRERIG